LSLTLAELFVAGKLKERSKTSPPDNDKLKHIGQSAIKNLKSKITIGGSYDDEN
jgi:hypothetical protein